MKKGQITIYLALVFTLILSVFLSAFEAARGSHLKIKMENAVQTAIHSTFGEYHKVLFERYGLLFVDTSYMSQTPDYHKMEERMGEYLEYNLKPEEEQNLLFARDWYDVQDYNLSLTNIRLATDDWGNVMKQQAVNYMQNYVGGDIIQNIQSWITVVERYEINSEMFENYQEEVAKKAEEAWEENNLLGTEWCTSVGLPTLDFQSEYMDSLLPQEADYELFGISIKVFNPLEHASYRWKIQGTEALEEKEWDITEELFFGEYILQKMGYYQNVREGSKLDYQVEYILFGQIQDSLNLACMAEALFTFRGAANLTMLLADAQTQETIKAISQLAALVEIPPQVVEAIINICWAAAESAYDVKQIMAGEKIPLLKAPKDFSVSINGIMKEIPEKLVGKDAETNPVITENFELGYEDYLRIFLFFLPSVFKTYRCMDMMEADIRMTKGNEYFRMDACADSISVEVGIISGYDHFYSMERKYAYY
ncbi:MAG: pilus assembly protein [Lachnospiraceae bacterium]|nr:pilus assembly protein [Lachnospiraceae bacterium]